MFYTHYENLDKSKEFFKKFDSIKFNKEKNYFDFEVKKYSLFNSLAEGTRQNWTICTHGDRIKTFRNPNKNNEWDNKSIVLTDEFVAFFKEKNINYEANDLQEQILLQTEK